MPWHSDHERNRQLLHGRPSPRQAPPTQPEPGPALEPEPEPKPEPPQEQREPEGGRPQPPSLTATAATEATGVVGARRAARKPMRRFKRPSGGSS
jgi:hypothetical protein